MRFNEKNESISLNLQNLKCVEHIRSEKQSISLLSHPYLGKILIIDGEIQHIEEYQSLYHELLVHLPAAFLPTISSVLIIGGGSLFAAYEALKYPTVQKLTLCDHDHVVLDVMARHYKHAVSVIQDPRFNYVEIGGWEFIEHCSQRYDLIINDCFNLALESQKKSSSCFQMLLNLCTESGVCADIIYRHIFDRQVTEQTLSYLSNQKKLVLSLVTVPEYPGILHIETIWGKSDLLSQNARRPVNLFQRKICHGHIKSPFQFFSPQNLGFYLYIPPYIKNKFNL